jgi:hypothetical protein
MPGKSAEYEKSKYRQQVWIEIVCIEAKIHIKPGNNGSHIVKMIAARRPTASAINPNTA